MTPYSLSWYRRQGDICATSTHPAPAHEDGSEPSPEEVAAYEAGQAEGLAAHEAEYEAARH
jgi:hypothetical protein